MVPTDHPAPEITRLPAPPPPRFPLVAATIVYLVIAFGAVAWALLFEGRNPFLLPDSDSTSVTLSLALGLGFAAVVLAAGDIGERYIPSLRQLSRFFQDAIRGLSRSALVWLGVLSAVAEELLFRGVLLPGTGLIASSILFGIAHIGPHGVRLTWMAFALVTGLFLGAMTLYTGDLIAAITAHAAINTTNLLRFGARSATPDDAANHS